MKEGDDVFHPELGRGTILRLYPEGPTAMVDFGYMVDVVPIAALGQSGTASVGTSAPSSRQESAPSLPKSPTRVASPVAPRPVGGDRSSPSGLGISEPSGSSQPRSSPRPAGSTSPISSLSPETVEARRAIVALRLGQVLESHVDRLSVGLDQISKQFDVGLQSTRAHRPVFMLVEGAWGQGKTHLLTLLTAAAVRDGFAVCSVVMDGVGVTLSDPMQLLEAITNGIRFPGDALPGGLSINLAKARRQGNLERLGHLGATLLAEVFDQIPAAAFENYEALQIIEDYLGLSMLGSNAQHRLEVLGYRGIRLPSLRARRIADRVKRFTDLLFNWTWLCAVAGARGLVVILDELDVEYASTARRNQQAMQLRERRQELLEALRRLRDQRLPLMLAFASAPAGVDIDPEYDASTNLPEVIGPLDAHIHAPVPGHDELQELVAKVTELYLDAYPEVLKGNRRDLITKLSDRLIENYRRQVNPVPRYFVRSALESLDIMTTNAL